MWRLPIVTTELETTATSFFIRFPFKRQHKTINKKGGQKTIEMMKADVGCSECYMYVGASQRRVYGNAERFGGRVLNKSIYLDSIYVTHGKQLS